MRQPEPTVGALITRRDGRVLLVRSYKWKDKYSVPGGHIEMGERAEEAIAREVLEETGLKVSDIRLAMVQQAIYSSEFIERRHFIFLDFFCKAETDNVALDCVELQEYAWVEPLEALDLPIESFTKNLINHYLETLKIQDGPAVVGSL